MSSKSASVKFTSSLIIQLPATSRATATATALGTKVRVISWICVIDWKIEIVRPTRSAVTRTGAASLAATVRPWVATSSTTALSMSGPSGVGRDERRGDEAPAVDEDEEQELERQGDHRGRQHHHAHAHERRRDDEVDDEEGD